MAKRKAIEHGEEHKAANEASDSVPVVTPLTAMVTSDTPTVPGMKMARVRHHSTCGWQTH